MHCTPFEYAALCLKAVQAHFPFQAEDDLLSCALAWDARSKSKGRKKRDPLIDICTLWVFLLASGFEKHFYERVCSLSPERGLFC